MAYTTCTGDESSGASGSDPQLFSYFMTDQYPTFEYTLNLKTSVTIDEAVAKMLGLMRGAVRGSESERINDDLSFIPELTFRLEAYFENLREIHTQNVIDVFDKDSTDDEKSAAYYDLLKCDQLINKAAEYKSAIDLELAYGKESILKIDQKQTDEFGDEHIYLASLDEWVRQKYQFSIYPDSNLNVNNPELMTLDYQNSKTAEIIVIDDNHYGYEIRERTINSIKSWVKSNKQKGYTNIETNNLLITFFSALMDVAKFKGDKKPESLTEVIRSINVSGTADILSQRILNAFNDVAGQSSESIRTRIENAKQAALNSLSIRK